jgi:hypothetical protein
MPMEEIYKEKSANAQIPTVALDFNSILFGKQPINF